MRHAPDFASARQDYGRLVVGGAAVGAGLGRRRADERGRAHPGDDWIARRALLLDEGDHHRRAAGGHLAVAGADRAGRGGLYSIDWLDEVFGILDGPSAEEILPEFQHLEPGDVIPIGGSNGWPVLSRR